MTQNPKPITSFKVTTGALPASRKVYVQGELCPDINVPQREIAVSGGFAEVSAAGLTVLAEHVAG